jgi:hypothetical protein
MFRRCVPFAIASILGVLARGALAIGPEGGIGITAQPDSVERAGTMPECPYGWTQNHSPDRFWSYPIGQYNAWINVDVDLLIDELFGTHPLLNDVTDDEARLFLRSLDWVKSNRFNWPLTDLGMAYQYYAESTAYDSSGSASHHFLLFPICADSARLTFQRDHADIYLGPAVYENESLGPGVYPCGAHAPSYYCCDADEDPPGDPGSWEWHANSLAVTDDFGNRSETYPLWPVTAAHGTIHEFTHLCWDSNTYSYGTHNVTYGEPTEYNELLACSSEYLAGPSPSDLRNDVRYAYSVLHDADTDRPECKEPALPGTPAEVAALVSAQRYHLWRLFGAYLGYEFHDADSLQQSVISRWARHRTPLTDRMERTFCGLAEILDDDSEFGSTLGYGGMYGSDGAYRTAHLFSNYGIARWVNYPVFNSPSGYEPYYFGPDFSPSGSAGQFRKIDAGAGAVWEYAIPPEFLVGGENLGQWTSYPDTADPCSESSPGWYDRWHDTLNVYTHACMPVKVDLWGSNYLVFRADTLLFGPTAVDTLVVQFSWVDSTGANLMNPRVGLWLSVLRYKASLDSLFLRGDLLDLPVETGAAGRWMTGTTVRVPRFRRDGNEAVVIVLTLVANNYSTGMAEDGCLVRRDYHGGEPCVDLRYSYRFRVKTGPPPPQGCPSVSSLAASGYAADNNVLYAARPGGEDVQDVYLLSQKPEAIGGAYRLRLTETADERTRFDQVDLLAVDHAADVHVAALQDGTVGAYRVTARPVVCRDQDGNDVLDLVLASDDEKVTVEAGGWLDVVFPAEGMTRSGGGLEEEGSPEKKYEELPPPGGGGRGDAEEGALSLAPLCYRANDCVSVLDMPAGVVSNGEFITVRVTAPTEYYVDCLSMVERIETPVAVTRCVLSRTEHSASGSCQSALASGDGNYATLAPGDTIDMTFKAPSMKGQRRDFVLLTRGGELGRGGEEPGEEPEASAVTISPMIAPNPFNPSTTVSFIVPAPGGRVAVSIYNMAGKLVRQLLDGDVQAGQQTVTWDGRGKRGENLSSGVYFCRIEVPGQSDQKKLVLLK